MGRRNVPTFRERREQTALQLRRAKESGVVAAIKPLVSSDACRVCLSVQKRRFPIWTCTVEMLPPYADCEYEDGCESCIVEILDPRAFEPIPGITMRARLKVYKPKRKVGLRTILILVGLAATLIYWLR